MPLYFSYGSNMDVAGMAARCPRSKPLGLARLAHHRLAIMREEGMESVWARHTRVAEMIRAGIDAVGLKFLAAEGHRSDTVTAILNPVDDADSLKELITTLRARHGLVLAGGQGDLSGRIFRIGHLGMVDEADVYSILATLEQGLHETGMRSRVGPRPAASSASTMLCSMTSVAGQPE